MKVERSNRWSLPSFREIWQYRELGYFLAWRDIRVRYKQTVLGAAWALVQPFMTMVVFSFFFGALAKIPSEGVPYPIFAFTALVPWSYFQNTLTQISNSMVIGRDLIGKVYFPRILIPVAALLSALLDFGLSFAALLVLMLYYGMMPTLNAVFLPILFMFAIVTSLGVGLWLATLNVKYRDVAFIAPFLVQFWLFATPIAYPSSLVPARWRILYGINPMTGVVEGFRWAMLGTEAVSLPTFVVSGIISVLLLVTGLIYFKHYERAFADMI